MADHNEYRVSRKQDDDDPNSNGPTDNDGDVSQSDTNEALISRSVPSNLHRMVDPEAAASMKRKRVATVSEGCQTEDKYLGEREPNASATVKERKKSSLEPEAVIPKRYLLLFMTFLGFINIYAMRVNLNVAIVAMVNNKTIILKSGHIQRHGAEFHWDSRTQGIVLGAFYYGYWVLQVPGAFLAMKLGGTRVFGYGVFMASVLSLLTPVATRYSVHALIGVRIFQGLALGVTFPCNHAIWGKWAPPLERSTLVTMSIAGCPVGNIIAIPVTGMLAKYGFDGGWPSVFYFFGFLGIIWFLAWEYVAYDSPGSHTSISKAERVFIEKAIGGKPFNPMTESLPWFAILTSPPMWGIIIGHFGACWGYYTLFTTMPTYLKDIQHLDIKTMGFIAATPYIFKSFLGPVGGITADILSKRGLMTIRQIRISFYGIGCALAGTFILATGYGSTQTDAITFLILGVGFSGLNATGYAVNHLDLAPRYAGILMGVSNTFATIPGFLSPMITGHLTKHKKPSEWRCVFWITFVIYFVCLILYGFLCSGTQQKWAESSNEQTDDIILRSPVTVKPMVAERSNNDNNIR